MGTTLATKQDLQLVATKMEFMALQQDVQLLRQEIATLRGDVSRDLKTLGLKMTVSLGSMLMVGFGLTITALRVWL